MFPQDYQLRLSWSILVVRIAIGWVFHSCALGIADERAERRLQHQACGSWCRNWEVSRLNGADHDDPRWSRWNKSLDAERSSAAGLFKQRGRHLVEREGLSNLELSRVPW